MSSRLDKQLLHRDLAVGRPGGEIGKLGRVMAYRGHRTMHIRVDMSVQRQDAAGAEPVSQPVEGRAAGVGEDQVEA
jgi:hypothetical protein